MTPQSTIAAAICSVPEAGRLVVDLERADDGIAKLQTAKELAPSAPAAASQPASKR
jgi:hypothetical protein